MIMKQLDKFISVISKIFNCNKQPQDYRYDSCGRLIYCEVNGLKIWWTRDEDGKVIHTIDSLLREEWFVNDTRTSDPLAIFLIMSKMKKLKSNNKSREEIIGRISNDIQEKLMKKIHYKN